MLLGLRLLGRGRADVAQHEQQHDGTQAASDAVEKRDAEDLGLAPLVSSRHGYGQSFAGIRNAPPLRRDTTQNALAARGSPSIGGSTQLRGGALGGVVLPRQA